MQDFKNHVVYGAACVALAGLVCFAIYGFKVWISSHFGAI